MTACKVRIKLLADDSRDEMDELTEATPLSVDVETIVSVLVDTPVTAAVLYGSHARGEHTEHSDIDLAIVYDDLSRFEYLKPA